MQHFSIGILSFAVAALFPVAYLTFRQVRRFGAWIKRENGPKERAGVVVVMLAVFGFALGSYAQPLRDQGVICQDEGRPVIPCVFEADTR